MSCFRNEPVLASGNAAAVRTRLRAMLPVLIGVSLAPAPARADAPAAAAWLPQDTIASVTLRAGAEQVRRLERSPWMRAFLESKAYEALSQEQAFLQAKGGVFLLAGSCGLDPWSLVGQALGRDLTVAVIPRAGGGEPSLAVIVTPDQADAAKALLDKLLAFSGATRGGEPDEARSRVVDGVRGYRLNDGAFIAACDEAVVFCNHAPTLEALIARRRQPGEKLARLETYAAAEKLVPKSAAAWGFLNLELIRKDRPDAFARKQDNAVGALLAGGLIAAARDATAVVAWVDANDDQVAVTARMVGGKAAGETRKLFTADARETRDWAALRLPGLLAGIELSRDWTGLWDQREALLSPDGLRDLLSFASTLTTLMGGLDFSSELLPELQPTLRLLAAAQTWERSAPTPQLPGFALLLHLKDPARLTPKLENAALMTLSIINVDAGQKMRPQYQMQVDNYRGTRLVTARFPDELGPGPRGIVHNFEPSMAAVGDRFVIATSRKMLEGLIDAYEQLPLAGPAPQAEADALWINMPELCRVLDANHELLVTNRMLEEDLERAAAERQVRILLDGLRTLGRLELGVDSRVDTVIARLKLRPGR